MNTGVAGFFWTWTSLLACRGLKKSGDRPPPAWDLGTLLIVAIMVFDAAVLIGFVISAVFD
jgi:hypothetical protein